MKLVKLCVNSLSLILAGGVRIFTRIGMSGNLRMYTEHCVDQIPIFQWQVLIILCKLPSTYFLFSNLQ